MKIFLIFSLVTRALTTTYDYDYIESENDYDDYSANVEIDCNNICKGFQDSEESNGIKGVVFKPEYINDEDESAKCECKLEKLAFAYDQNEYLNTPSIYKKTDDIQESFIVSSGVNIERIVYYIFDTIYLSYYIV